jgi:hypothetical protein
MPVYGKPGKDDEFVFPTADFHVPTATTSTRLSISSNRQS